MDGGDWAVTEWTGSRNGRRWRDSEGIFRFGDLVSVLRGGPVGAGNCLWVFQIRGAVELRLGL